MLPRTIRGNLLLLVLCTALPLLAVTALVMVRAVQSNREHTLEELQSNAAADALAVDALLFSLQERLRDIASLPEVQAQDVPSTDAYLARLRERNPQFGNFYVLDRGGVNAGSPLPEMRQARPNQLDVPVHRQVLSTGRAAVSEARPGPDGEPVITLAVPLREGEPNSGLVGMTVALRDLSALITPRMQAHEGSFTVLDLTNTVIARAPDAEGWAGRSAADTTLGRWLAEGNRSGTTRGLDGTTRLAAAQRLQRAPWRVVVTQPRAGAAEIVQDQLRSTVMLMALLVGGAVAGALLLTSRIAGPLRRTAASALAVAPGPGGSRASPAIPRGIREVENVAAALDHLARATAARLSEVEALARFLAVVNRGATIDQIAEATVSAAREAMGCDVAGLALVRPDGSLIYQSMSGVSADYRNRLPGTPLASLALTEDRMVSMDELDESGIALATMRGEGLRAAIAVPCRCDGEIVAVLSAATRQRDAFDERSQRLFEALADGVGVAVERARLVEREQQSAARLRSLGGITDATLAQAGDVPAMLNTLAERIAEALGLYAVSVRLRDDADGRYHVRASYTTGDEPMSAVPLLPGEGIAGLAVSEGRPVYVRDVTDPEWRQRSRVQMTATRSMLSVPMRAGGQVIGVVNTHSRELREFASEEVQLLEVAADRAALLVEQARLVDQAQSTARHLEALQSLIDATLAQSGDIDAILAALAARVGEALGVDAVTTRLFDAVDGRLLARGGYNLVEHHWERIATHMPSGTAARAIAEGRPVYIRDAEEEGGGESAFVQEARRELGSRSILAVPMPPGRRTTGVIVVHSRVLREFTPEEVRLLEVAADRANTLAEQALLYQEAQQALADRDAALAAAEAERDRLQRAEAGLRESEERSRTLVESAPDAIVVLDLEAGRFVDANERAAQLFKMPVEELLTYGPAQLSPPVQPDGRGSTDAAADYLSRAVAGEVPSFEWVHRAADGTDIPCEIWLVRLPSASRTLIRGSLIDITERKRAEAARRAAEAERDELLDRLQLQLEQMPVGCILHDAEFRITYANPSAEQIFGYTLEELRGKLPFGLIVPGQASERVHAMFSRLAAGEQSLPGIGETFTKDGRAIVCEFQNTALRDREGVFTGVMSMVQDITVRQEFEAALQRSEARLAGIVDSAMDAIITIDESQHIVLFNRAAEVMFGHRAQEMIGRPVDVLMPHRYREGHRDFVRSFAGTGVTNRSMGSLGAVSGLRANGEEFPIEASISQIEAGGQKLFTVILRDITGRLAALEAERALRAEREELVERLQLLFDRMPVGCIVTDKDLRYTYWNPTAERIFGYRFEDVHGKHPFEVVTLPSQQPRITEVLRRLQAGILSTNRVNENRTADGRIIICEWQDTPLFDAAGQFIGVMSMCQDVTERQRAEEERAALVEREQAARAEAEAAAERLRSVQAVTDVVLPPLAMEELLDELLPRVRSIFEADTASVLTPVEGEQRLVVRGAVGVVEESLRRITVPFGQGFVGRIATERQPMMVDDLTTGEVESPTMRASGMRSLAAAPMLVEGRLFGVLHVGSRTAYAFGENDLLLLQLLADRITLVLENARLQRQAAAAAAAMEADRLKTDLLNTVSHELRTPLAAIKGFTTTIQSFYSQISEEELREFLGEIDGASDRLQELIENLLQLSRMESGTFQLRIEPVALAGMLRQTVEEARRRHTEREITLEIEAEPPVVRADERRLGQVLANLIENAVKYSPDGGEIAVRAGANGRGVWFSVTDHGLGIAPEHLDRIFERFYRVDTPRTREIGGTGLGLAISSRIVEEHGGRIDVQSTEGEGSTFTVTLPPA